MQGSLTRLVMILGAPDSGKTTLLASLWDLFQLGPFAGYLFAGSRTQPAFERRCHLSRRTSRRLSPDTERTRRAEKARLIHLAVRDEQLRQPIQQILFSDIAGETLNEVRVSTEEAQRHTLLQRADHVIILLDGKRLVSLDDRQSVRIGAANLLRSLLDADILGPTHYVEVLISKWDLVAAVEDAGLRRFAEDAMEDIVEQFAPRLARLRSGRIAARPNSESPLDLGFGVAECFRCWIEDTPLIQQPELPALAPTASDREFARYRWRRLRGLEVD